MKYICITEVDAVTKIPCTVEPQRTGPSMPAIKGWVHLWHNSSTWPVSTAPDGTYLTAPKYYGTCDDDADTSIAGILEVLTEQDYNSAKLTEHIARRPFASWVGDFETMSWTPPVPRPADAIMNGGNVRYQWDEATVNWIPQAIPA
jgi:hypothetical protein